ncbi:MAG: hypothetical protein H0T46_29690 [Deltaproteobacteria bacterium]|nr:hypothetical protein [Deltaproteobacteria bacterium]
MLALIIDPDAAMRTPVPPAEPPPAPPPAPPPPPVPVPTPEEPWHRAASAAVVGAGGLLPGMAVGVDVRVSIDPPSIPPIALRANLWREDEQRNGAQGARFRLLTGGLTTCPSVWRLELCGGVALGRLGAEGFGFDRSQQTAAFVAYLTVEPQLRVSLRAGLALTVSIGTWIPLVRPRFFFDQDGQAVEVYQPGPAAVVGHAGLTLRF